MDIDIKIPKAEGWYLDFNDAFLLTDLSIVKDDDAKSALGASDDVALVNFVGAALFKDVKLVGSGQKVEGENQSYMYKAYLYTLLSASVSAKKYQLAIAGWERDEAEKFDDAKNKGPDVRKAWTATSETHQLVTPVLLDSWMKTRYMPDEMDFVLSLQQNDPKFVLHYTANGKYK